MESVTGIKQGQSAKANLQNDIKTFTDELPIWGKILAAKILAGFVIDDDDIETAYQALLETLKIAPDTKREKIDIKFGAAPGVHYEKINFDQLGEIEGINALAEEQLLKFSPQLTIIYGTNGSGKSGYIRLLKKVFHTKSREEILPNIHIEHGQKTPRGTFAFSAGDETFHLKFPGDKDHPVFSQYSVFDGKAALTHLDDKNALEFRPAGLSFFSSYADAIKRLDTKLQEEIRSRQSINPFPDLFEGDSPVKTLITGLSANTKLADLQNHLPFTEEDQENKKKAEAQYDDLLIASKGKEKEISNLNMVKLLLQQAKTTIEKLNHFFTEESIKKPNSTVTQCCTMEALAKQEGIEGFTTDLVKEIGSPEWKNFIVAADAFALIQKEDAVYPENGDHCLLCHQPLSAEARELIAKYRVFIKSEAEKNAAQATRTLEEIKIAYEKLTFDVFTEGNVLTAWMTEKKSKELSTINTSLKNLKKLAEQVASDLSKKVVTHIKAIQADTTILDTIMTSVDYMLKVYKDDTQQKELANRLATKVLFAHREKLQQRILEITAFVDKQVWISKAGKVNWDKRKITETEKSLSGKYFNQQYIDTFNAECQLLDANFGIHLNHTGTAGASYRQLSLKGKSPSAVLSEGEQKVIALADFITEVHMSGINRGIVFDDPVNSLDERRKKKIAQRLTEISKSRQVIVFSHDLVFVSSLITHCQDSKITCDTHWIEKRDDKPGLVFLNNAPSYEKEYRNSAIPMKHFSDARKDSTAPALREYLVKTGFTALRTCYEVLVISELFKNVVQRFNERVSVDSLDSVYFDQELVEEIKDGFVQCCRYMEGHTHSDLYAYQKPELEDLKAEIDRYDLIRKKVKATKKPADANA